MLKRALARPSRSADARKPGVVSRFDRTVRAEVVGTSELFDKAVDDGKSGDEFCVRSRAVANGVNEKVRIGRARRILKANQVGADFDKSGSLNSLNQADSLGSVWVKNQEFRREF